MAASEPSAAVDGMATGAIEARPTMSSAEDASLAPFIGKWHYQAISHSGTYVIENRGGRLHYVEEEGEGELDQVGDNELQGEMFIHSNGEKAGSIRIRLVPGGLLSNFMEVGDEGWGPDIVANRPTVETSQAEQAVPAQDGEAQSVASDRSATGATENATAAPSVAIARSATGASEDASLGPSVAIARSATGASVDAPAAPSVAIARSAMGASVAAPAAPSVAIDRSATVAAETAKQFIGKWHYQAISHSGTYVIENRGGRLHYVEEEGEGELDQVGDDELQGEMFIHSDGRKAGSIRIRLVPEGLLSNFMEVGDEGWGPDIVANRPGGWLLKRGPMANYGWQRRWCILDGGYLEFYEDTTLASKKGDIEIEPNTRAMSFITPGAPGDSVKHVRERPFGFVLDTDPSAGRDRHLYYFDAETQEAMESWIMNLTMSIRAATTQAEACFNVTCNELAVFYETVGKTITFPGPNFCFNMALEDVVPNIFAAWGTSVIGMDTGQGWLRVGDMYLPFQLEGCRVLVDPLEAQDIVVQTPASKQAGDMTVQALPPQQAPPQANPVLPPGCEQGNWDYICVDPTGMVLLTEPLKNAKKSSQRVLHKQLIQVSERRHLNGIVWLYVTTEHLWAYERMSKRCMSEIFYEPVPEETPEMVIFPKMQKPVMAQPTPYTASTGGSAIHAGVKVRIKKKARVLVTEKKEIWKVFFKIMCENGSTAEGWLPEQTPAGEPMLVDFKVETDFGDPEAEAAPEIAVVSPDGAQVYCEPGRSSQDPSRGLLPPGELAMVSVRFTAGGLFFYKLLDGSWVCESDIKGKPAVEIAVREPHTAIYAVSEDSLAIRKVPSHHKQKAGHTIKKRARVVVSEKITFANGEIWLKTAPPSHTGWVNFRLKDQRLTMKLIGTTGGQPPNAPACAAPGGMQAPPLQGPPLYSSAGGGFAGFAPPQPGFAPPQPGFAPPQPGFAPPQPGFAPPQPSFAPPQPGFAGGGFPGSPPLGGLGPGGGFGYGNYGGADGSGPRIVGVEIISGGGGGGYGNSGMGPPQSAFGMQGMGPPSWQSGPPMGPQTGPAYPMRY